MSFAVFPEGARDRTNVLEPLKKRARAEMRSPAAALSAMRIGSPLRLTVRAPQPEPSGRTLQAPREGAGADGEGAPTPALISAQVPHSVWTGLKGSIMTQSSWKADALKMAPSSRNHYQAIKRV